MYNWIIENEGMIVGVTLFLIGYAIIKHFLKKSIINRYKNKLSKNEP